MFHNINRHIDPEQNWHFSIADAQGKTQPLVGRYNLRWLSCIINVAARESIQLAMIIDVGRFHSQCCRESWNVAACVTMLKPIARGTIQLATAVLILPQLLASCFTSACWLVNSATLSSHSSQWKPVDSLTTAPTNHSDNRTTQRQPPTAGAWDDSHCDDHHDVKRSRS